MDERDSFIFYRSFYEAIQKCPNDVRLELYDAIAQYSLNIGYEPKFSGIAEALWILIKPQLDANIKRFENGRKGGAPKGNNNAGKNKSKTTEKQPKNNQKTTEKQPNNNYNLNENNNNNNTHSNTNVLSCVNDTHADTREEYAKELIQDENFAERTAMNFHVAAEDILILVNSFNNEQAVKGVAHVDYNDYRRHAYDWIRIQIEKKEKERKHGNPADNIREAQERQIARLNKIAARDGGVLETIPEPF